MKILMISYYVPPAYSGAGAQALALAVALVRRGHQVTIVSAGTPGGTRTEDVGGVSVRRLAVHANSRVGRVLFYSSLVFFLAHRVRRYEVVHVHGIFWPTTIAARIASWVGVPLVVKMTRDGDDDPLTLDAMRSNGGMPGRARFYPLVVAERVVSINRSMYAESVRVLGAARSVYLPNAVDVEWFRPPTPYERSTAKDHLGLGDGPLILFTGGYIAHKGLATLLDSLDLSVAGHGATVAIVGVVGAEHGDEVDVSLRDVVRRANSTGDVRFVELGLVDRERMRQCYWASDVFVLLSEREGHPNSLLEAMACGIPCVATAIPGIVDIDAPGDAVTLVEPGDTEAARRALRAAFESRATGDRGAGRDYIASGHSITALARRYEDLYATFLNTAQSAGRPEQGGR